MPVKKKETVRDIVLAKDFNKQEGYFYKSNSKYFVNNNGYMPYSKNTVTNMFNDFRTEYGGDTKKAIRHICIMFDVYYNDELAEGVAKDVEPKIGEYLRRASMSQYKGKTYVDTIHEEDEVAYRQKLVDDLNESRKEADKEREDLEKVDSDTLMFFGDGFSKDDYAFLISQFNDWKKRTGAQMKAEEELIKNLCFNQLEMRKLREAGESTKDIEATYIKNLQTLGYAPNQNSNNDVNESSFGSFIKKIENKRPISEPDEEFKDVNGIKDYIEAFFLVPMAKSIGLSGVTSRAYDRLMKKFSIKRSDENISEDDKEAFDNLFSKLKNSGE